MLGDLSRVPCNREVREREINPSRTAVIIRKCFNPDDAWVMDIQHRSSQEQDISLFQTNNCFYSHETDDSSEKIRLPCCLMCTIARFVIPAFIIFHHSMYAALIQNYQTNQLLIIYILFQIIYVGYTVWPSNISNLNRL